MNPAFSKTEAVLNGYEEAIVLTQDGKVSEGSAENLFMVRRGRLVTPGVHSDILEGITRAGIIELARAELGLECEVRSIDRSELYVADEVFLCGTGAQVSPVSSIDHRPVGNGQIGPITGADHARLLRRRARPLGGLPPLGDAGLLGPAQAPRHWRSATA